jgi:hypothetical protein
MESLPGGTAGVQMKADPAQNRLNSQDVLYLGLILLVILSIAFLLPVEPNDYWWHVRIGQETLQTGSVPDIDTLSYTQFGKPVNYFSWLSEIIFALVDHAGGLPLTVLIRGSIICLGYAIIFFVSRKTGAGTKTASFITLLAALATSNNWSVRPQMFTYFLFAAVLWILYDWQKGGKKGIWLLPVISFLWVNLHGSFIMLFLLAAIALIFGRGARRGLAVSIVLSLLATLINPDFLNAWKFVILSFFTDSSRQFSMEWSPPVNLGWQMQIFFAWLLLLIPLAAISPRKLTRLEWALLLVFGWLALSGQRYVIWFVFILAPITVGLLAEWGNRRLDKPGQPGIPWINISLGLLFLLMPLALLPGIRNAWWRQAPEPMENTPIQATSWLTENPGIPGPMWSELGFSSYLIYALPSRPVWIDPRFEVAYSKDQFEKYISISNAEWDWQIILNEEGINLLVISKEIQPKLLTALQVSPNWANIHEDDIAVIFERNGSK